MFHALVAECMLQRTKAEQVLPVYNEFTSLYPSLESISSKDINDIRKSLTPLGLKWRIENIVSLLHQLKEKHIPTSYDDLVELPRIGDYCASAFLSLHLNTRRILVDSNTVRLWGRFFGVDTNQNSRRNRQFRTLIDSITPITDFTGFNYATLDLSRSVYKKKPNHKKCPLNGYCKSATI